MAQGYARIGRDMYSTEIEVGGHKLIGDEPPRNGGQDAGPAPYDFLLAGLGSCTAITLRMYADRKQWTVRSVGVELRFNREQQGAHIERLIAIDGDVTAEQRARLMEIAEKTPVTLTLKSGTPIRSELRASL